MKTLLICLSVLLLSSCGLFHETPPAVVKGQRAVYEAITISEDNDNKIIDRYVEDTKAAVTYHLHFVCERSIRDIADEEPYENVEQNDIYIEHRSNRLRDQRDHKIKKSHADIDKIAKKMRSQVMQHHKITKKLVGAIYNYMSTSPIEVDSLEFLVEKLSQSKQ